jgi:RNA polymerase sigma factor (sigma-70 family)
MTDVPSVGPTSVTLLQRLRDEPADQSAWEAFVERYSPTIRAWCRRWRLQEEDINEVVQTVLVELASKMRTFSYDPSRSFRGWLWTLTRNTWVDSVADWRRQVPGGGVINPASMLATVEARDDLERQLQEAFDLEVLQRATARVRTMVEPRTWDAFRLTAMEGLSGAEAADRLGMNIGAIYKAKSNVQKRLREQLAALNGTE